MIDHGHDLIFGTFLTPSARDPEGVLELAVLTDRVGLDLVTFQDHPYQPSFLDASTLMTFVAARTERVQVAANVANLPLRPPGVLARATASLDLLSGGRAVLGLGAGAFAEAAEAMGAPVRTTGERITGLREAIEIIRALWDTESPGAVRQRGEIYTVDGAKRGPAPAHPIPIWVGALKPRMLALTGSHADGWLPSWNYLPGGTTGFDEGNARIDEAALAAGRRPSDVRRVVNVMGAGLGARRTDLLQGPADAWIDDITALVLEHGLGGLILATDDPDLIRTFAHDVVPAVREAVEDERSG